MHAFWRYQLGRTLGYGLGGILAGFGGATLTRSLVGPWPGAIVSWTLALAFAVVAYQLWNVSSVCRAHTTVVGIRPRKDTANLFERLIERIPREASLWGASTILLPCGALYAVLVLAAGTLTPFKGAAVMVGFSLTSGMALLSVGWLARRVAALRRPALLRIVGVLMMVLAVVFVVRPLPNLLEEEETGCCSSSDLPR